jgi:glycosyltransferase involved in cell wall biosynthesis
MEAMACGTPVVVSDVGAMSEVVVDGVTGFLVPPNDPAALRDRIRRLLGDPGLAARLGAAARRRIVEKFTWEAVAERCLAAYAKDGRRGGREG